MRKNSLLKKFVAVVASIAMVTCLVPQFVRTTETMAATYVSGEDDYALSTYVVDDAKSTWTFTKDYSLSLNEGDVFHGLYINSSGISLHTSNSLYFNKNYNCVLGIPVGDTYDYGSITITDSANTDTSRTYSSKTSENIISANKAGSTGYYTSSDIEEINGQKYVFLTTNKKDLKVSKIVLNEGAVDNRKTITIDSFANGTVSVPSSNAVAGDSITITTTANKGYYLSSIVVKDENDNNIAVSSNKFTMPNSNVTITAIFSEFGSKNVGSWENNTRVTTWQFPTNTSTNVSLSEGDEIVGIKILSTPVKYGKDYFDVVANGKIGIPVYSDIVSGTIVIIGNIASEDSGRSLKTNTGYTVNYSSNMEIPFTSADIVNGYVELTSSGNDIKIKNITLTEELNSASPTAAESGFYAQHGDSSVRFVYSVSGSLDTLNETYSALGVKCTSNGTEAPITGTIVFDQVASGSDTFGTAGGNTKYVIIEITGVESGTSFVVTPIALDKNGDEVPLYDGNIYAYTMP